ncbi:hypothetical protein CTI12_AA386640 [Artemisia annua]|uniref:Ribosomal RNA-processing protein 42 n=1 Tax=Artemisia annua TaxID=35608 RepID=A0A2U1MFH3_ARTAN|nr:hypothetical protein CTI12_AA386640 [Artemisia annua]
MHFIQGGIAQDLRTNGRKRLTYRPFVVETAVIAQANGSARVKIGITEAIVSVKLNYLITEDKQREIIDTNYEGVESEILNALLSLAIQCVSSTPEDRSTMYRVVQTLESEIMTLYPSDFSDSASD